MSSATCSMLWTPPDHEVGGITDLLLLVALGNHCVCGTKMNTR